MPAVSSRPSECSKWISKGKNGVWAYDAIPVRFSWTWPNLAAPLLNGGMTSSLPSENLTPVHWLLSSSIHLPQLTATIGRIYESGGQTALYRYLQRLFGGRVSHCGLNGKMTVVRSKSQQFVTFHHVFGTLELPSERENAKVSNGDKNIAKCWALFNIISPLSTNFFLSPKHNSLSISFTTPFYNHCSRIFVECMYSPLLLSHPSRHLVTTCSTPSLIDIRAPLSSCCHLSIPLYLHYVTLLFALSLINAVYVSCYLARPIIFLCHHPFFIPSCW